MAVAAAFFAASCGGDDNAAEQGATTAAAAEEAAILVTRDCGKTVLLEKTEVPADQDAMRALLGVADVETDDGGKFVTAIEGVERNTDEQLAWLFYVNGTMAEKGAAEVRLEAGDVEWWDLHDWEKNCPIPPAAR